MPEPDAYASLASLAAQLVRELEDFGVDAGKQFVTLAQRARSNRRIILALCVSVALDIALSVVLGFVVVNQQRLTDRLNTAQTTQRQKALCPLYTLLLGTESAAGRAAAKDRTAYDHSYTVIRMGYDSLECEAFVQKTP